MFDQIESTDSFGKIISQEQPVLIKRLKATSYPISLGGGSFFHFIFNV